MKPFSSCFAIAIFIMTCVAITQLPFARAHSQIEEACTKYNTIMSINGTKSCVSILNSLLPNKQTLSSLPGRETSDDSKTMALAVMEFAEVKVSQTAEMIKNKLKDKSLKPKLYGPLRSCMRLYNEGSYSFGFGLLAFKEQNYEIVNYQWLNGAYYDVFQCERELNKVGVKGEDLGIEMDFLFQVFNSAQVAFHYFANKSM